MAEGAAGEQRRVKALEALEILDTPQEPIFDRLTQLASSLCRVPIAIISLIDSERQWFKSMTGLQLSEISRTVTLCKRTLATEHLVVIEDTLEDPDFRQNMFVSGPPHIRFYAGAPLVTAEGFVVGTMALLDYRPRRLSKAKIELLGVLADQVMTHMELRRQRQALQRALANQSDLNAKLARQAEHLREAQRIAEVGSWEMTVPSRSLQLSEETFRIFGVPPSEEAVDFSTFISSVHKEDRDRLVEDLERTLAGIAPLDTAHRIVRPGGEVRHVRQRGELRAWGAGEQFIAGTVQDVTRQYESQATLQLLDACIARVSDVVLITEAKPSDEPGPPIVFVNQAFERTTGYSIQEVLGRSPRFLQGPKTQASELLKMHQALERLEHVSIEVINYRKDGSEFWAEIDVDPVFFGNELTHFVAVQRDISERKASEQKIEQLAFFDPLTHLPNRRLLLDRLDHAIKQAAREGRWGAILFLDLDNFKSINDTLGHEAGDKLLVSVARRINEVIRASNTVARLGGDEFVILLEDLGRGRVEAAAKAETVAEKVVECLQAPFDIGGDEHTCTTSVGVILFSSLDDNCEELLKRADVAMYQAKAAGRNAVRYFDQSMQNLVNRRVAIERDLRTSLRRGDFVLHFQPQVDENRNVVAVEALVRWNHPREGLLYPSAFIPVAEESRLIVPLGQWILENACQSLVDCHGLDGAVIPRPRIAINVSAHQFHRPDFVERTRWAILNAQLDPHDVTLEMSESLLIDNFEATAAKMKELKKIGVRFSLDDFGTGYSSLAYLKRLPLDEVKIDRSFVRDILDDPDDAAIIRTIISLCDILGFEVIAEGVETEEQRGFLSELGCHVYQGYLFSRPHPAPML